MHIPEEVWIFCSGATEPNPGTDLAQNQQKGKFSGEKESSIKDNVGSFVKFGAGEIWGGLWNKLKLCSSRLCHGKTKECSVLKRKHEARKAKENVKSLVV